MKGNGLKRLKSEFVPSSISSETTCKPSDARMLGQSICENVQVDSVILSFVFHNRNFTFGSEAFNICILLQVIEGVFSLALISETAEGPYVQTNESPVPLLIDGSQYEAVQTALAELKKISKSLLRM